jgi:hypothetical protein
LKRPVLAALRLLAGVWPRGGIRVAHALAWLTGPFGFGIALEWLAAVFPDLSPDALRAARRGTWSGFLKGEALEAAMVRAGRRGYPPLVPDPEFTALEPPLIFASFHVGPFQGIGAALRVLPGEAIAVTRGQFEEGRADVTLVSGGESEWERARTFYRAVVALRARSSLLITVDANTPDDYDVSTIDAPMFGGTLPLARGAFALSRVSGVPITPLVARWRGTELEVVVGDPISPDLGEAAMAAATARWVEDYLRERPGESSVFMLERLRPDESR